VRRLAAAFTADRFPGNAILLNGVFPSGRVPHTPVLRVGSWVFFSAGCPRFDFLPGSWVSLLCIPRGAVTPACPGLRGELRRAAAFTVAATFSTLFYREGAPGLIFLPGSWVSLSFVGAQHCCAPFQQRLTNAVIPPAGCPTRRFCVWPLGFSLQHHFKRKYIVIPTGASAPFAVAQWRDRGKSWPTGNSTVCRERSNPNL